jgi:hypothetical protein
MDQVADPPRKRTPSFGGLQVPPPAVRESPPPSLIPEEREDFYRLIRGVDLKLDAITQSLAARLDEHAEEIRQLRESVTIAREVRQELREQSAALHTLAGDVRRVMRSDAAQELTLAQLESAAAKQTRRTAAKFGIPGALITIVIALAERWWPALRALLD